MVKNSYKTLIFQIRNIFDFRSAIIGYGKKYKEGR